MALRVLVQIMYRTWQAFKKTVFVKHIGNHAIGCIIMLWQQRQYRSVEWVGLLPLL